jgi:exonuclease SbcD
MKSLPAADIHLDSPLAGLCTRDDLPEGVIRHCTRRAFAAMVDLARDEDVAFVVIAGDLYDDDWKDFSTGLFFAKQMRRLGRPCFLLRGNHDARSVITRNLKLPGNVREFCSRTCETMLLPEIDVALHGHSFPNRAAADLRCRTPITLRLTRSSATTMSLARSTNIQFMMEKSIGSSRELRASVTSLA